MRIRQFIPVLHRNDAIGESIILFSRFLDEAGIANEVCALDSDRDAEISIKAPDEITEGRDDINLLHYALPSPVTGIFLSRKGRKVLVFHNITPASYFKKADKRFVNVINAGYREIDLIKDQVDLAIADSSFNRSTLESCGYNNVVVYPVFIDFSRLDRPEKRPLARHLGDYLNVLVLGRVAPNKRIEDAIRAFNPLKLKLYPKSRLWIAGKATDHPDYYNALLRLASAWGLTDIHFTGKVTERELSTFLRHSTLLLSLSEHEGFCVPVLEAFYSGIPVVAYDAGAVAETMGEGGIILKKKDFHGIAELIYRIKTDSTLASEIIETQKKRLAFFSINAQRKRAGELIKLLGLL